MPIQIPVFIVEITRMRDALALILTAVIPTLRSAINRSYLPVFDLAKSIQSLAKDVETVSIGGADSLDDDIFKQQLEGLQNLLSAIASEYPEFTKLLDDINWNCRILLQYLSGGELLDTSARAASASASASYSSSDSFPTKETVIMADLAQVLLDLDSAKGKVTYVISTLEI